MREVLAGVFEFLLGHEVMRELARDRDEREDV
jgi:hypothetical protein